MVITGLHRLVREKGGALRGRRVGLITHAGAVTPDLQAAPDALAEAGVELRALFAPEHGLESAAADADPIAHATHPRLGIPIHSLYGETRSPTAAMLADLDILVFDMQDVGARFYTYLSTLFHALRAAGQSGLPIMVLDRPNPINGLAVEGPLIEPGLESFIGIAPLPVRHGMTLGELARWLNAERNLQADLTVIAMEGWRREMWFDDTGLPWAPPSPAMPHPGTAIVYPGTCLLEGTNLSEGRGTALPFEVAGAPWLDGYRLAQSLNALNLPGARFRATHFIPGAGKHSGQLCQGVQAHVMAREALQPVRMGAHLLAACRAAAPEQFAFLAASWEGGAPHLDLLIGNAALRTGIEAGAPVAELIAGWPAVEDDFRRRRAAFLLYE